MARGKFIAYYRVSTAEQGRSGLGLEAQRAAVVNWLNGGLWTLLAEYKEVESGKRNDRPELARALAACRKQGATLVMAKLDRLARNVAFIARVMESGVEFVAVDNPHANKLTVHILAAMAEFERDQISARTKAALAQARERGTRLGNPRWSESVGLARQVQVSQADSFAESMQPLVKRLQEQGATTLVALANELNERGIRTARGGAWYPTTVKNLLERVQPR